MTSMFDFLDNVGGEPTAPLITQAEMQMMAAYCRHFGLDGLNQVWNPPWACNPDASQLDQAFPVRHISGKGK